MIAAREALERLKAGNERFATHQQNLNALLKQTTFVDVASGQKPFAIILGCSDSRVPAEIVFDQGLGDLFVIRVAGNIVAPSQIGSVEFAADRFETPLVIVLGHSQCGAIYATLEDIKNPGTPLSRNLRSITDRVRPSIEELAHTDLQNHPEELVHQAVRANIRASVNHLRHGSHLLESLIDKNQLLIVGAEYALETGRVEFFDVPGAE